ncbi:hypothetical protein ACLIIZ_19145 [Azonexus caeni]|uniref:hypothetical protein n=1 Tax=Azonexus caeni TaxID=266126 RepID=UPI003A86B901
MVTKLLPLLAVLALGSTPALGDEFNATLRVTPEYHEAERGSPYFAAGRPEMPGGWNSNQEVALRYRGHGFSGDATLRWETRQGQADRLRTDLNQFYFDSALGDGLAWTIGKKVLTWGIGFAFRPLDVVQRENRRSVTDPMLVGIPLLSVEKFSINQAWTAVWTQPGQGGDKRDRDDEALAFRWYKVDDKDDLHAVARFSRTRKFEAGFGANRVIGNEWSVYGGTLYSHRYPKTINTLGETGGTFVLTSPLVRQSGDHANKSVVGAQWTGVSGWSALLELFHDGEAYRKSDWRRLDALVARQHLNAALAPAAVFNANLAWSANAYTQVNVHRDNALFRVSYDNGDGFKPYVELLNTPTDGGLVTTLGASYEGNRFKISGGVRHLGGDSDSVYARAPERYMAWVQLSCPIW